MSIKVLSNHHNEQAALKQHERDIPPNNITVPPNDTGACDMWTPWCTSANDFKNKHYITLGLGNPPQPRYWIWEHNGSLKYNTQAEFQKDAPTVPGSSSANRDKMVVVEVDGRFRMEDI